MGDALDKRIEQPLGSQYVHSYNVRKIVNWAGSSREMIEALESLPVRLRTAYATEIYYAIEAQVVRLAGLAHDISAFVPGSPPRSHTIVGNDLTTTVHLPNRTWIHTVKPIGSTLDADLVIVESSPSLPRSADSVPMDDVATTSHEPDTGTVAATTGCSDENTTSSQTLTSAARTQPTVEHTMGCTTLPLTTTEPLEDTPAQEPGPGPALASNPSVRAHSESPEDLYGYSGDEAPAGVDSTTIVRARRDAAPMNMSGHSTGVSAPPSPRTPIDRDANRRNPGDLMPAASAGVQTEHTQRQSWFPPRFQAYVEDYTSESEGSVERQAADAVHEARIAKGEVGDDKAIINAPPEQHRAQDPVNVDDRKSVHMEDPMSLEDMPVKLPAYGDNLLCDSDNNLSDNMARHSIDDNLARNQSSTSKTSRSGKRSASQGASGYHWRRRLDEGGNAVASHEDMPSDNSSDARGRTRDPGPPRPREAAPPRDRRFSLPSQPQHVAVAAAEHFRKPEPGLSARHGMPERVSHMMLAKWGSSEAAEDPLLQKLARTAEGADAIIQLIRYSHDFQDAVNRVNMMYVLRVDTERRDEQNPGSDDIIVDDLLQALKSRQDVRYDMRFIEQDVPHLYDHFVVVGRHWLGRRR